MAQISAHSHAHDEPVLMAHGSVLQTGISNGRIAIWLFLASEVMFFTGLIGAYIVLRGGQGFDNWPDPTKSLNVPLTALNTFLLICSSVTLVWGLQGYQADKQKQGNLGLLLTTIFGAIFVGVQVYEYVHLIEAGVAPWKVGDGQGWLFCSCFYSMTSFHGLHVFAGVIYLSCMWIGAARGKYGSKNSTPIEIVGLYWHFVDLVWILLFTFVYLIAPGEGARLPMPVAGH
jgi:heme/copper-type cytochrome/quinol oxidase subunit 3